MTSQSPPSTEPGEQSDLAERLLGVGRAVFPRFALAVRAETSSTQDDVRRAIAEGAGEGFCCVALNQNAGRGRQGRSWHGEPGQSLLVSLLINCPPSALTAIPLATGLAVIDTVTAMGATARLKWPNDILSGDGGKLAGILVEGLSAKSLAIAGIGLNISVKDFPTGVAGSNLSDLLHRGVVWQEVLIALLPALRTRWDQAKNGGVAAFRDDWMRNALGFGGHVRAETPNGDVSGTPHGIDDDGALLLETDRGVVRLLAADVHIGPPRP